MGCIPSECYGCIFADDCNDRPAAEAGRYRVGQDVRGRWYIYDIRDTKGTLVREGYWDAAWAYHVAASLNEQEGCTYGH